MLSWGDIPPLRTNVIRLLEGDLFVSVVNAHGLQADNATAYCMDALRPTGMALATMQARMDAVCLFHNLCGTKVKFLERLQTGEFFSQKEVLSLREGLRLRNPNAQGQGHSDTKRKGAAAVVKPAHWRNRCIAVRDYVVYHAEEVIQRMSVRDERLPEMRHRLATFVSWLVGKIRVRRRRPKKGLSESRRTAFLNAITPEHPTNPFAVRHQVRNHALWLMYYDAGLRKGEGLGLKCEDLLLNGAKKKLTVERRPDDIEETRKRGPLAKTLPHPVPLTGRLAQALSKYMIEARPFYPGAKRSPYVFFSQMGEPLSEDTIAYMYRVLREKVPELPKKFSTHLVRYTWNDRFGEAAEKLKMSPSDEKQVRNLVQGWVPNSEQEQNYQRGRNESRAETIIRRMQDGATGEAA